MKCKKAKHSLFDKLYYGKEFLVYHYCRCKKPRVSLCGQQDMQERMISLHNSEEGFFVVVRIIENRNNCERKIVILTDNPSVLYVLFSSKKRSEIRHGKKKMPVWTAKCHISFFNTLRSALKNELNFLYCTYCPDIFCGELL